MAQIDLKNMTFRLQDAGGHHIEVKIGTGNCTYDTKTPREYTLDRGRLDTVRNGNEEPTDVSIDATWEATTAVSGGDPTIEDALYQTGGASDWISTSDDECEPYCVDLIFVNNPPCSDGSTMERTILAQFRVESINHDCSAGVLKISGKCNITRPTVTRGDYDLYT